MAVPNAILLAAWGLLGTAAPVGWWTWLSRVLRDDAEAGGGLMVAVIHLAMRVPLADGALVATIDRPSDDVIPSLLALSDVMGTGWFAADAACVHPGSTVVVGGDGAVGLLAVLSATQMGAERIIAMSRHEARQKLAREFGAPCLS